MRKKFLLLENEKLLKDKKRVLDKLSMIEYQIRNFEERKEVKAENFYKVIRNIKRIIKSEEEKSMIKFCKKGEIYYADLGETNGHEQNGIRPVLVVQNDTGNLYSNTTIIAPITTQKKTKLPTHVDINLKEPSTILCEQIKTIDKNRLNSKIKNLNKLDMRKVNKALKISLGLNRGCDN